MSDDNNTDNLENVFDLDSFREHDPDSFNETPEGSEFDQPSKSDIEKANELRPEKLSADEGSVWDRLAPFLVKENRLKALFVDVFYEYCVIRVRLEDARDYLDKNEWEYVVMGRNGSQHKSRPQVAQLNDDWRKWKSLVGELGLGPNSEKAMSGVGGVQTDLFNDL